MIKYKIQKVLRTLPGMTVFSSVLFFGLTLLLTRLTSIAEVAVIIAISLIFGIIFSISMQKRMGPLLLLSNMNKDQYDRQRKFGKMLEREEIPKNKAERIQYLDFLTKLEKVFEVATGLKNMILLLLPCIAAIQIILFTKGFPLIKLLAVFLVIALSISYVTSRKKYQKIKRLKSRLGIA